jgi:hypothetical protein
MKNNMVLASDCVYAALILAYIGVKTAYHRSLVSFMFGMSVMSVSCKVF